jgi:predicted RNase H-like HicB family nuclease
MNIVFDLPYQLKITLDEDSGYGVEVVELPGCFTYADRWDDIPSMAREAIGSWVGSALKHGDPVPEPTSVHSR